MGSRLSLDRGMFPLAVAVLRANWMPCGVAALLLLAANAGQGYVPAALAFAVVRALIIMIVGYAAYRTLLSGGRVRGWRAVATPEGRMPWRYAGVMLMILSPILVLGIVWTSPGHDVAPTTLPGIAFGVTMVLGYTAAYVLIGTALPEVAERGEVALSGAIARGRANYRVIARAMVFGPWLFRAGSLAFIIGLSMAGVTTDPFNGHTGAFQPAALGPMLLLTSAHVFAEILTAIVMCRAYRRHAAEPAGAVAVAA